jgi:hypothetical protein
VDARASRRRFIFDGGLHEHCLQVEATRQKPDVNASEVSCSHPNICTSYRHRHQNLIHLPIRVCFPACEDGKAGTFPIDPEIDHHMDRMTKDAPEGSVPFMLWPSIHHRRQFETRGLH